MDNSPKKVSKEGTVADSAPPFFDQDMDKWKRKFEKSIDERNKQKKQMASYDFNLTTKNSNFHKSPLSLPKRRMSR